MAHFLAFARSCRLNKLKNELLREKLNASQISEGETPRLTLKQKYRHCLIDCRLKFKKCFSIPKRSRLHRFLYKIKKNGTLENFLWKSILGFVGGFCLTYVFFVFLVVQLNFKLSTATVMCAFLGTGLMIGMAFSPYARCIVFLTLPQFFSKRGRQALLAYAFILAITGPAKNTLNNMGILSESLACGQEELKSAIRQIIDIIKKPFYAIRDAIKSVVKTVKEIVKKIKEILLKIKRIIMAILRVIKAAFQFLGKILNICNKELGTPFQRCSRVFDNAIADCHAKLGPIFSWLCSITYLVKSVCYLVKIFDYVCMLIDFVSDSIIGVVVKKVKAFMRQVRTMFYVRIKFSHSFHFQTNTSKSYSEVASGIVTEIKDRTRGITQIFDYMSLFTSMFFSFLILKVLQYRYKYLTSDRFDNKYITRDFRFIDLQRAKFGKETILPLNHREQNFYIPISSCKLVKTEKRKLAQSAVFLGVATLKLGCHMIVDYSLYWVLNLIRYYGRFQSKVQAPNVAEVQVQGRGLLADLLKAIIKAFRPFGTEIEIDTVPCLPNPIPPDYDRYIQIASLVILCWLLTLLEPYGLRLRQWIMCFYHPLRAKQRAVWLYNHIMRSRSGFLKFARRQLRRKVLGRKELTKITWKEYLRAKIKNKLFRFCFLGPDEQLTCFLCGEVFREKDQRKPIICTTPDCPGIYCQECFNDLKKICTVCKSPMDYGDLSDLSEEKGSPDTDEDQEYKKKIKEPKKHIPSKTKTEITAKNLSDSSDISSDHSYSYQYQKSETDVPSVAPSRPTFKDVEKQEIPDYASMASFSDIHIIADSNETDLTENQGKLRKIVKPTKTSSSGKSGEDDLEKGVSRMHDIPGFASTGQDSPYKTGEVSQKMSRTGSGKLNQKEDGSPERTTSSEDECECVSKTLIRMRQKTSVPEEEVVLSETSSDEADEERKPLIAKVDRSTTCVVKKSVGTSMSAIRLQKIKSKKRR